MTVAADAAWVGRSVGRAGGRRRAWLVAVIAGAMVTIANAPVVAFACSSAGDCNDQNPCTDDLCDPFLGCLHANNHAPCNDGNACTTNDVCNGGVCVGGDTAAGCSACQAVANVPASGGTFVGNTTGTSTIAGSCGSSGASPERAYKWIPRTSGTATIQTCGGGTAYDTVVYVRKSSCTGTQLACNDDASSCAIADGTSHGSRVKPTVTAGQTYYVVVDGYNGRSGAYTLTIKEPQKCGNNLREGSEACDGSDNGGCPSKQCTSTCTCVPPPSGLPDLVPEILDVTFQYGTTVAAGDVAEGCAEGASAVDLLRFSVKNRNLGTADFVLGNPQCPSPCTDHPLEVCGNPEFICSPSQGHNHAHYNNYARYELLDANGQQLVLGHKQGFCLLDSICANPKYTCTNQGMRAGCADEYRFDLGCQYLDITGVPMGSYTLRVRVDPFNRIAELNDGNNVTEVPVTIGPIAGAGTCSSPTVIPAAGGTFTGVTSGSSARGSPCGGGNAPEKIFKWTPATSGTATIETCGTGNGYDTLLYARRGSCTSGTVVGCNNDTAGCATAAGSGKGSRIRPAVTAGQTYFITVDGSSGAKGNFSLTVTPP